MILIKRNRTDGEIDPGIKPLNPLSYLLVFQISACITMFSFAFRSLQMMAGVVAMASVIEDFDTQVFL